MEFLKKNCLLFCSYFYHTNSEDKCLRSPQIIDRGGNESVKKLELTSEEYKKRILRRCIHHFISDLIHNTDQMHISGTEPSSVILSQTKQFKNLKNDNPKVQSKLKLKWMV